MLSDMHVIVYCNEGPDAGTVYYTENLDDQTTMDCRAFAERVANSLEKAAGELFDKRVKAFWQASVRTFQPRR